jgi:hypothetical protein
MSDLTKARPTIQLQETQFKGAVSESFAQRVGAGLNMALTEVERTTWFLQGGLNAMKAGLNTLPRYSLDGPRVCLRNTEVVAFSLFTGQSGNTGTYEIDILRMQTSTQNPSTGTSIFSTTPQYTLSAISHSNSMWIYDLVNGANLIPTGSLPVGDTANSPALDPTDGLISAYEWLVMKIVSIPPYGVAADLQFTLYTRPR